MPQLDGESLVPLLADPSAKRARPAITTFGRGNHAVRDARWTYLRYFDGTEELYDRQTDPGEHRNLAPLPQHSSTVDSLAAWMPEDLETAHFVRMGTWKVVVPRDAYPPLLFDLAAGGGIGEQQDVAAEHPDVLARVLDYLRTNNVAAQHVLIE